MLCSWDGEEYGLLGSTAFGEPQLALIPSSSCASMLCDLGENNYAQLYSNAIAYLNVDVGVTGTNFGAGITPSLAGPLAAPGSPSACFAAALICWIVCWQMR